MRKNALVAALATLLSLVAGGLVSEAQAAGDKNFHCSNQGGGPNHTVDCSRPILSNQTVYVVIGDVRVLNGVEISILENSLNNIDVNADATTIIAACKAAVINTFAMLKIPVTVDNIHCSVE